MLITDDLFSRSFYYIGAGLDAQPLWRFSHLCDTFVFTNLFLDKAKVRDWYERQIRYHYDAELLSIEDVPDFDEYAYLPPTARARQHRLDTSFMTPAEQRDYAKAFHPALGEEEWGLVLRIRRPSLDRVITLYYFTAEGLATYVGLSDNGRLAPLMLCTVDTKVLETPDGMMSRLLARSAQKPLLWLRGFAPSYRPIRWDNHALDSAGEMPVTVMNFQHGWECGWSYDYQQTQKRYVRGFAQETTARLLQELPVQPAFTTAEHRYVQGRLAPETLHHMPALVVLPRRVRQRLALPDEQTICWEDVVETTWYGRPASTAATQLAALQVRLAERGTSPETILHLLPFCYEDEGQAYVRAVTNLSWSTCTYLSEPADFLDLRLTFAESVSAITTTELANY